MSHTEPVLFTVRPRRIAIYAGVGAILVVALMIFVAIKLRSTDTGVYFRTADAVSLIGLGLLFAGGMLLVARPRLRVDATGLRVRNVVGEKFIEWALVQRIAFPEGANWAQLELADDELIPVMAIQAMDRQRAVAALQQARALVTQYAPPIPVPSPEALARRNPVEDPQRPLGRLEQIDLIKAAQGKNGRGRQANG